MSRMDLAALAIAALSLIVSAVLGIAAARLSRRLAAIEEARRLDERTPKLDVEWLFLDDGEPAVRVINMGPQGLDRLEWDFEVNYAEHPVSGLGRPPAKAGAVGAVGVGDALLLPAKLSTSGPSPGELVLRFRASAGEHEWIVAHRLRAGYPERRGEVW